MGAFVTVNIITADVIAGLRQIPADSVDCVVTSPPYWGLRDYGVVGQLGLEPTSQEHITAMVAVFEEVRRVLKPTGTLWLNYGDCYASSVNGRSAADTKAQGTDDRTFRDKPFSTVQGVLKAKDLCMIPNRLAIALQEAGWWVRSEIIWAKPNPMPESITDRPATAHEKVFLLTKSARYSYYADAVRQTPTQLEMTNGFRGGSYVNGTPGNRTKTGNWKMPDGWDTGPGAHGSFHRQGREKGAPASTKNSFARATKDAGGATGEKPQHRPDRDPIAYEGGRNLRNWEPPPLQVWKIATQGFSEAHFATFPPELVERCLMAGTKPGDMVLDPFGGAGTTGLVADQMGRDATLIELSPDYVDIAARRLRAKLVRVTGVPHCPAGLFEPA